MSSCGQAICCKIDYPDHNDKKYCALNRIDCCDYANAEVSAIIFAMFPVLSVPLYSCHVIPQAIRFVRLSLSISPTMNASQKPILPWPKILMIALSLSRTISAVGPFWLPVNLCVQPSGSLSFSSPYFICESIFNRACRLNEVANVIIYSTLLDPLRSMLLRDAVGLAVYKTANP